MVAPDAPLAEITRKMGQGAVVAVPGAMPCIVGWDHPSETWEPAHVLRRIKPDEEQPELRNTVTPLGGQRAEIRSLSLPMCWKHADLSWGM